MHGINGGGRCELTLLINQRNCFILIAYLLVYTMVNNFFKTKVQFSSLLHFVHNVLHKIT